MSQKHYSPEEYKFELEQKSAKRKDLLNVFQSALAILLGCAMVFSSTIIAYKKANSKTPIVVLTEEKTEKTEEQESKNESQSVIETEQKTEPTTTVEQETIKETDANKETEKETETEGLLSSFDSQYEYFIKSFNGVKQNAKTAENYKKKGVNYKGIAQAGSLSKLLSTLMNTFLKEEEPEDAVYSGEDIMAKFPPAGAECHLKKTDIKKIEFSESGKYYIVKIYVKDEVDAKAGYGVGSIASIITREQIMDPIKNIPGLKKLDPTCAYENVSCEAKIEKSTGNMVEFVFDLPLILSFEKQNLKVGLEFFEWWRMTY